MSRLSISSIRQATVIALLLCVISSLSFGATKRRHHVTHVAAASAHRAVIHRVSAVAPPPAPSASLAARTTHAPGPVIQGGPWTQPTFADSTNGDNVDGEDLIIRRAAVEALGPYNGSVVVVDPSNGRILTMVNQRIALGGGFQPCSTVKISVALAGLAEKAVDPTEKVRLGGMRMDMTYALAHSNNLYFATLGEKLGYQKVAYYAHLFGYGEKAGLNIPGEQPGHYPQAPPKNGGVGMLTSFGEEIQQTPLQLAALMSAIANGGTLYYLQYPHTPEEVQNFEPKVKRDLNIANVLPGVREGMLAAVLYGTGRLSYDAGGDETPLGKTGTCDDHTNPSRIGWFVSYADETHPKIALAVLLRGNTRRVKGPTAAQVAGGIYRRLRAQNYFSETAKATPAPNLSAGK
jgi:penicillin-binding protein 2